LGSFLKTVITKPLLSFRVNVASSVKEVLLFNPKNRCLPSSVLLPASFPSLYLLPSYIMQSEKSWCGSKQEHKPSFPLLSPSLSFLPSL
jgi:hypothetical protein